MFFTKENSITPKTPFTVMSKAKTIKMGNTTRKVTNSSKAYSKKMDNFNNPQMSNYDRTGVIAYDKTTPPKATDYNRRNTKGNSRSKSNMWRMSNKYMTELSLVILILNKKICFLCLVYKK